MQSLQVFYQFLTLSTTKNKKEVPYGYRELPSFFGGATYPTSLVTYFRKRVENLFYLEEF